MARQPAMRQFRYRAVAPNGSVRTGLLVAASAPSADLALHRQGLSPIELTEATERRWRWSKPTRKELALAVGSVASLVEASAPLRVALETAEALAPGTTLRAALAGIRQDVIEGQTLFHSLERSGILAPSMLGVIKAGEQAGRLESALVEAAALLEHEAAAAARLQRALTYPAILLVTGVISIALISVVVVPRFAALLSDVGRDLPPATRLLLAITTGLRAHGPLLLVGVAGAAVAGWRWSQAASARAVVHRVLLALPVIGRFRIATATARLTRALGGALRAGAPLLPALEITRAGLADRGVRRRLERAIPQVAGGSNLTGVLSAERVVAASVVPLIGLGEANGRLADMLLRASEVASAEADRLLDTAITLIEPCLVLALGSLIAFVAAAMFQAVYSLGPGS